MTANHRKRHWARWIVLLGALVPGAWSAAQGPAGGPRIIRTQFAAADPAPAGAESVARPPAGDASLPAFQPTSIIHKIHAASERIEITVNSSRILTLGQDIPQVQVGNPELLDVHVLAPDQIQIFGKTPGVTQINLWGADKKIYTLDVVVFGDSQALSMTLRLLFPNATVKVVPIANGVILNGYVDQPENVSRIVEIAQEYYPKVINNMRVAGVQEVYLHVKIMEVSRTKLRQLGFDFAKITNGTTMYTGISGLLSASSGTITTAGSNFGVSTSIGNNSFFGVLNAMRQDDLMKVLAEPTLVTVSGRPAQFTVGGEFPMIVPESLGTVAVEFKKYGTVVDFLPIVMANGRIRLEVRPVVSEIDESTGVTLNSIKVPGLKTREVETGVELTAGQTLAIAGLVQTRADAENISFPVLGDLPYIGTFFRKVQDTTNEIELLILVTPELIEAQDATRIGCGGPGTNSVDPNDCDFFLKGHLEVPACNGPGCGCRGTPTPAGGMTAPGTDGMMLTPAGGQPAAPNAEPLPPVPSAMRAPAAGPGQAAAATYNRTTSSKPQTPPEKSPTSDAPGEPGFIGPVGYEVH